MSGLTKPQSETLQSVCEHTPMKALKSHRPMAKLLELGLVELCATVSRNAYWATYSITDAGRTAVGSELQRRERRK